MTFERLSLSDDSLIFSYSDHIQRYKFAMDYCRGKSVLDAGCGIGYGSHFLASSGARSVLGLDISADAIAEAARTFVRNNLHFQQQDVETITTATGKFDTIVNFENLEHLT